jgi:subtilase family serine protease
VAIQLLTHPLITRLSTIVIIVLAATSLVVGSAQAANGTTHVIHNNTPGFLKRATDQGPLDPSTVIAVTVWLKLHNQTQLNQLVQQQYRKGSSTYHHWLTQDQFDVTYAPTTQEVKSVQNFLTAHKLTLLTVAENNLFVKVQGTVADIQKTFHVQIHNYNLNGVIYRSNTSNPSINDVSGANVAAITGLDDYGFEPNVVRPTDANGTPVPMRSIGSSPNGVFFEGQCFRAPETQTFSGSGVTATYTGNRFGSDITNNNLGHLPPCGYSPAEMQTAYNMNALYSMGLDGTGETVVIVDAYGSPTIAQDAEAFSQIYGLPDLTSDNFQIVRAPGLSNNPHTVTRGWDYETSLDVEWVHALAPGANIALVVAPDRGSLAEAINYAVVHHLGNTISNSWSGIEGFENPASLHSVNLILEMAAAKGIDVNFASGDYGDEIPRVGFQTVDFPASSPFATGIGGTSLALNADNTIAFQTGWGNNGTLIAEGDSLGNPPVDPPLHLGFFFGAGGGPSLIYAKPSFQSALPGTMRQVPDVSMLADPFTGGEFIMTVDGQLSVGVLGGTSLACPMFSALMAIAAQKNGHRGLGQAAPLLYSLPAGAVTDVRAVGSPNNVIGSIIDSNGITNFTADQLAAPLGNTTTYYSALYNHPPAGRWFVVTFGTDTSLTTEPGWDNVTGVGTPNGVNFVNALVP